VLPVLLQNLAANEARGAGYIFGETGLQNYPKVRKLVEAISARPAATRATQLSANLELKSELDEETRRALFPQNL
jgi:GST-like protein